MNKKLDVLIVDGSKDMLRSMANVLERLEGDRTRLISRVRVHVEGALAPPYVYLFDEWGNFLMQRKRLPGIKARAED